MKLTYLAVIALTAHAMPHFGACPDVPGVENFSMADFAAPSEGHDAAKWYERERDSISHKEFRNQHDIRRARLNTDC